MLLCGVAARVVQSTRPPAACVKCGVVGRRDAQIASAPGVVPNGTALTLEDATLERQEQLVDARVLVKLGVEGESELVALARGDDPAVHGRERLCVRAH